MTRLTQSAFAGRFGGTASLQNRLFCWSRPRMWPRPAKKGEISGAVQPPPNPHRVTRVNDSTGCHALYSVGRGSGAGCARPRPSPHTVSWQEPCLWYNAGLNKRALGGAVSYSLALGPFHPAWRGPQRFVLKLDGEHVADIEYTDGFNERGCAERLPRLALPQALHLVTRICGTCSFAHSLAFCQALEQLCAITVSQRAGILRCVAAELERIASHTRAAAAVLRALGMDARAREADGLREQAQQTQQVLSGARVIPDLCVPGGLRRDLVGSDREALLVALPKKI